ncbi:DUF808 domain-containing protein [Noviherbaspirillum aerium]|uniref:DUF808 domain-containing protein n=1 Tax=Noviherbaspirillum aerium TaxID=2588497 RepID=UPI00124EAF51|nr:DUF808 domain-containing protein [Noviherbaspirillum aerium]
MASSLLAVLDDIAYLLDDVSAMSKLAAKKVTGVLSDDIAVNANQVSGFASSRELPVVWAVAKGSFLNKAILAPLALAIVAFAPWALTPLLMAGGAFLCFEGAEKLYHRWLRDPAEIEARRQALVDTAVHSPADILAMEKGKIRAAIRTDAILSGEIIAVSLGTMQGAPLLEQAASLAVISVVMTAGVYGLVTAIVKLDDIGIHLASASGTGILKAARHSSGRILLLGAPYLMKSLSVVGTIAMFLVGGGIITHGIPASHDIIDSLVHGSKAAGLHAGAMTGVADAFVSLLANFVVGILVGTAVLLLLALVRTLSGHARRGA